MFIFFAVISKLSYMSVDECLKFQGNVRTSVAGGGAELILDLCQIMY